jgi:Polysaccharide pyruvyl transferase
LPRLTVLGLREAQMGRGLALALGVPPNVLVVTGDDALELTGDAGIPDGDALGLSVRVSGYAGVDLVTAKAIGELTLEIATTLNAPIVALPVSQQAADADVLRMLLMPRRSRTGEVVNDPKTPEALFAAVASCRVVVTGSYHAAVFGLAQGVPTVCFTRSSYYDAKFGGLQALFPGACFVLSLDMPDFPKRLRTAIQQAWNLPASTRTAAKDAAIQLRNVGRETYAQFRIKVEKKTAIVAVDSQEGLVA